MDDFAYNEQEDYFEQEPLFQNYMTSYFELDNDFDASEHQFKAEDCKYLQDTAQSESLQTELSEVKNQESYKQGLYKYQPREMTRIEVTNKKIKDQYVKVKKGHQKETLQLAINYKTIIKEFLQEKEFFETIPQDVETIIKEFKDSQCNLVNFRKLFGVIWPDKQNGQFQQLFVSKKSDSIREFCVDKISQKEMGERILNSSKMQFKGKITALKFLEILRKGCIEPEKFRSWKEV